MESEKVKKVKKALDVCRHANIEPCRECPYNYTQTKTKSSLCHKMAEHALTLIYELERENESLKDEVKVWKGFIEDYKICCDKKDKENKQLEDCIAKLEKENAKYKQKLTTNQWVQEIRKEALKQFAERLKEELKGIVGANFIDEILKETIEE